MRLIYLDHNSTTPLKPEVKKTILDNLDVFGNASSLHPFGYEARKRVEEVRQRVFQSIHAREGHVIFTSSGSEANNLALKGIICTGNICRHTIGKATSFHLITSAVEHPSVFLTADCLKNLGSDVTFLPVDSDGMVDPQSLQRAIRPDTLLISIMMANNEVGTIMPAKELGAIAHEHGILFHVDAVQALGKIPVNVEEMNIDLLTLSGHKLNAPKGIGALYAKQTMRLCPMIHGGHQELNLRAGTENTLGIFALGTSLESAMRYGSGEAEKTRKLRDQLHQQLVNSLDGVHLNGHPEKRLPGTLNLRFDKIDGAAVLEMLAMQGVAVSSGSACSSGSEEPSHVLTAMGLPPEQARSSIRISLGYGNTEEDILMAADIIIQTVKKLRSLSPL